MLAKQLILIAFTFSAFAILIWRGRMWDRAAVATMVVVTGASFASQGLIWRGAYVGIMAADVIGFLLLWLIAERAGRWWIIQMAGFQLIGTVAHFAPFLSHQPLAWALISLMWGVWFLIGLSAFFGVWEVEADRRSALGGQDGSKMVDGGGAGAAEGLEQPHG